jgi:two-component system LytT family sensor kinase
MDAKREGSQSPPWFWIASIWSGIGLFDATQTVFTMRSQGMHHAWVQLFVLLFLKWLPWAAATPLVIGLGRRYPPMQLRAVSGWLAHIGAATGIGLICAAWEALLTVMFNPWAQPQGPGPFIGIWLPKFYYGLLSSLLLYAFILAIRIVLDSKERMALQKTETACLNEQLSKSQLDALRRQIEPHFLFNTLNAIAGLVRQKRNDAAVSMIVSLSDFLRRAVEDSNRPQVPLEQEVEFLQRYLEIQKVRFAERLQLSVDVPREFSSAQVPSFLLQPLVENAIKHGIAKRAQGGTIRITASRGNGMLNLSVYNDGPGLPEEWPNTHSGIGISNLRTRLQILYGNGFDLTMRNQDAGGVEASVSVPFKEE